MQVQLPCCAFDASFERWFSRDCVRGRPPMEVDRAAVLGAPNTRRMDEDMVRAHVLS